MNKLLVSSLFFALSTGAFAQALSQVMPGTWVGTASMKFYPRVEGSGESPKEMSFVRDNGANFVVHPLVCGSDEMNQAIQPLAQHAYDKNQLIAAEMKVQGVFEANGKSTGRASVTYSTPEFAPVSCSTVSEETQLIFDDARSQLVDAKTGEVTKVKIMSMNEIIMHE